MRPFNKNTLLIFTLGTGLILQLKQSINHWEPLTSMTHFTPMSNLSLNHKWVKISPSHNMVYNVCVENDLINYIEYYMHEKNYMEYFYFILNSNVIHHPHPHYHPHHHHHMWGPRVGPTGGTHRWGPFFKKY